MPAPERPWQDGFARCTMEQSEAWRRASWRCCWASFPRCSSRQASFTGSDVVRLTRPNAPLRLSRLGTASETAGTVPLGWCFGNVRVWWLAEWRLSGFNDRIADATRQRLERSIRPRESRWSKRWRWRPFRRRPALTTPARGCRPLLCWNSPRRRWRSSQR
jgi:hypothetical protein